MLNSQFTMPPEFWQAIEQFNQQDFYTCHDILEALWMEANEPQRSFYQGILQIAVAFYHHGNRNLRGAIVLLGEGIGRLSRYQPDYAGIEVTKLLVECQEILKILQQITIETDNSTPQNNDDVWEYPRILSVSAVENS